MLWMIYCTNRPDATDAFRDEHREAHRAYLKKMDPIIFFSGPLQSDDGKKNIGNVFIIKAKNRAEAQAFSDGEGYTRAGMFESVKINPIRKSRLKPELDTADA